MNLKSATLHLTLKTLHDVQQFLGDVQWLRPVVGITNDQLELLQPLLKGTDPASPVTLSAVQQQAINEIGLTISQCCVDCRDMDLTILAGKEHLLGALTQSKKKKGETGPGDIRLIEWIFGPLQPKTTIQTKIEELALSILKGRTCITQITGDEPSEINVPMKQGELDWYLQHSPALQSSLLEAAQTIDLSPLRSTVLKWMSLHEWIPVPKQSERPLPDALTVFTDAGKHSRRDAVTWQDKEQWRHELLPAQEGDTLQTLELAAIVYAFLRWMNARLNVITDSLYAVGIVQRIEDAHLKGMANR